MKEPLAYIEDLKPDDEPVFLIRGKDHIAPEAVEAWANLAEAAGARPNIVNAARKQAQAMREWQSRNKIQTPTMEKDVDIRTDTFTDREGVYSGQW